MTENTIMVRFAHVLTIQSYGKSWMSRIFEDLIFSFYHMFDLCVADIIDECALFRPSIKCHCQLHQVFLHVEDELILVECA